MNNDANHNRILYIFLGIAIIGGIISYAHYVYTQQVRDPSGVMVSAYHSKKQALPTLLPVKAIVPFENQSTHCPSSENDVVNFLSRVDIHSPVQYMVPANLVEISDILTTKDNRRVCLEATTTWHAQYLFQAAQDTGLSLVITSGYRDEKTQQQLYIRAHHADESYASIAHPWYSEHHLGTTIDITTESINYASASHSFGISPEGQWMRTHAHEYGFTMSYPSGKESITGYRYEPWHWRFVGIENATMLYENNLTLTEFFARE